MKSIMGELPKTLDLHIVASNGLFHGKPSADLAIFDSVEREALKSGDKKVNIRGRSYVLKNTERGILEIEDPGTLNYKKIVIRHLQYELDSEQV